VPIDRPETGLVIRYDFLWVREHEQGAGHGDAPGERRGGAAGEQSVSGRCIHGGGLCSGAALSMGPGSR
jgi:hypothetical protein